MLRLGRLSVVSAALGATVMKREELKDEAACALREYGEIGVNYNVMLID